MRRSPHFARSVEAYSCPSGGVRSYFESVSQEPLTAELMELLHKMDSEGGSREVGGSYGRGVAKVDRIDRGG
jgi:hypothetical protein